MKQNYKFVRAFIYNYVQFIPLGHEFRMWYIDKVFIFIDLIDFDML